MASLLFVLKAWTLPVGAAELPRVTLNSEASVVGPNIVVSDLLTEDSKRLLAGKSLEAVSLSVSPLPGKAKLLDLRAVRDKLTEVGITSDRYSIQIPEQIRVDRRAQLVLPREIQERIEHDFLPGLPWEEVRLVELDIREPIALPLGDLFLRFQQPARTDLARPFYLAIDFVVDGQTVKHGYFKAALSILHTVAVADKELAPSAGVTAEDIRWEKRLLRTTLQSPVGERSFFEGKRPRTAIAAGQVLTESMFVSLPLVKRGDSVTVVFDDGKIRVSTLGQSLGSGLKGDRIRVMNTDSRAELRAEIVDSKTVRIVN
jgi:flagella basal body P-ring formation protein FlgA